ncbi:MAG: hypothetical protein ACOYLX_14615 [Burkholderiaceae bacterium]
MTPTRPPGIPRVGRRDRAYRSLVVVLSGAWVGFMLMIAGPAQAARPMTTDDARIVDDKACQVESWVRNYRRGGNEFWALPGCNPTGNLEITLGGASFRPQDAPSQSVFQGQLKTLFKPLEPDGWGIGLAIGTVNTRPQGPTDTRNHPYFYVPASFAFSGERLVVHANVGATRGNEGSGDVRGTWGIGAEYVVVPRALVIAETYGVRGEPVQMQVGLRLWAVPNRVQVDATFGNQGGTDGVGRWFSIGVRLLSPPFLP